MDPLVVFGIIAIILMFLTLLIIVICFRSEIKERCIDRHRSGLRLCFRRAYCKHTVQKSNTPTTASTSRGTVGKDIEKEIIERSLHLISKSNNNYKDVKERYDNECNASEDDQIDWHKVFITGFSGVKGTDYVSAIDLIARLVSENNSQEKRNIYFLVYKLIHIRAEEKVTDCPENQIKEYQIISEAWGRFRIRS